MHAECFTDCLQQRNCIEDVHALVDNGVQCCAEPITRRCLAVPQYLPSDWIFDQSTPSAERRSGSLLAAAP